MIQLDANFISYASNILAETNKGLSGSAIASCLSNYAMEYSKDIPFCKYPNTAPNKRSMLEENLKAFEADEQYRIIKELCELFNVDHYPEIGTLKQHLFKKYSNYATDSISNTELVQETKHWLSNYPNSLKLYESALEKYENGIYERNALDDMRLSFELLVKDLLKNKKSLENQIQELGQVLKGKGASKELRNMITTVISYYTDYQNNHIKHDDQVNRNELEFIIELTSVIMKYLIKA